MTVHHIPIAAAHDRHLADGEILVEPVESGCGAATSCRDDGRTHFHAQVIMGAIKQTVEQVGERSVGAGVIHRRTDHETVGLLKFLCHFVHHVVEHTMAQLVALAAGNAASDVFIPDVNNFGLYAVFL